MGRMQEVSPAWYPPLPTPTPFFLFFIKQDLYCVTPTKIEKVEGPHLMGETYQEHVNGLLIDVYINTVSDDLFH
jgi:hypothetical protein